MRKNLRISLGVLVAVVLLGGLVISQASAQPQTFTVTLTGGGAGQDPNGSGTGELTTDAAAGKVCFELAWAKIKPPFAAHIHIGAEGATGDIVVHFFDTKGGVPLPRQIKGVSGCARNVDGDVIEAIDANPAGYYVNVHNKPFPAGAIRGQVG